MGKPKAPAAPDPKQTSAASTSTNIGTAIANAYLSNPNQITPDGTLTTTQTGMHQWYDPYTKRTYNVPTFTTEQTLSEMQQQIKDQGDAANLNLATLGNNLSGTLGQQLTGNFKLGNEAVENRIYDLAASRLDPRLERQRETERTRLLNSGIREGSTAWTNAMNQIGQNENDAYNSILLNARGQATNELLTEDNQRINQISALLNGGQVSQPNFVNANMPTIPTTDVAGIINQDYQNRMGAYQQQQASMGGLFSGLGSLAGGLIGLSDDEEKKNKTRIGDVEDEMGLWEFNYKSDPEGAPKQLGLMASEVKKSKPSAVKRGKDGKQYVDYGKALGLMGAK
jgi:hypothetical protein